MRCTRSTLCGHLHPGLAIRAKGGPSNTGEWQAKMGHWHRNLFVMEPPEVPMDGTSGDREESFDPALPEHVSVEWMDAVGLDRSVRRRGLTVVAPATADRFVGVPGIRVLKPIGARLQSQD